MRAWTGLAAVLALVGVATTPPAHAQSRKPTAHEIAAIRDCAAKNQDNIDAADARCLFKLVANPCMGPAGNATDWVEADCYLVEAAIWDDLLNANYKSLLASLDDEQTAKARTMQQAWIAYRDTTCGFYDDKIRGSMSIMMRASCIAQETERRAMLLKFFSGL
jgi:uncharacterized protein YecT (DUF1311 family)